MIYNNVDLDFAEHDVKPDSRNKYFLKPGKTMEEWIEADGTQKRTLFIHEAGKPSVALTRHGIYSAFLIDDDGKTLVRIIDESGTEVYSIEGRDPVLRTDGQRLFLLFDTTKTNAIVQNLLILGLDGYLLEGFYAIKADDLNFAADMRYHPERKLPIMRKVIRLRIE